VDALERTGALQYARERALASSRAAAAALAGLAPSPAAASLLQLATFAADRSF
jgi:geranylgeranyl pyrophosphate synthase